MKSISDSMLIHNATVYFIEGMDADRNPIYSEGIELSNVWFNITKNYKTGNQGEEIADSGMMFFDASKSIPSDFIPSDTMKIVFDNAEYFVSSITKCTDSKGIHHFEIGLK